MNEDMAEAFKKFAAILNPPAETEDCQCEMCVKACELQPGWFAPGQAEKAAELLGIPFEEFKNNLAIDHASNHEVNDAPYIYTPKKIGVDREGTQIRTYAEQERKGICVFLKE